jgi:hypothetical protein
VIVEDDDGFVVTLPALHMSGLSEWPEKNTPKKRRR